MSYTYNGEYDYVNKATVSANRIIDAENRIRSYQTFTHCFSKPPPLAENIPPDCMLHLQRDKVGVFFGKTRIWDVEQYVGKPADIDGNCLVVGSVGTGKTSGIAKTTLESWPGTIFAIDVKGDLLSHWQRMESPKRPVKVFSPTNGQGSNSCYDPYYFLRIDGEENLIQNARELVQAMIPMPVDAGESYFWIQAARHVLTAAILYFYGLGASFCETMTGIMSTPARELIDSIAQSNNLRAALFINQARELKIETLSGIMMEIGNRILPFAAVPQIKDACTPSSNCIRWEDLETHTVFLQLAEDKLEQWESMTNLMVTQLIRSLERRPEKYSENGKCYAPLLLLLDEFPRLGKIDAFEKTITTLRSKGVTICIMCQSIAQLDRIYGKDVRRIIVDNCAYRAILGVCDPEDQQYFSRMAGTKKIWINSYGISYDSLWNVANYNQSVTESQENLIHPHELCDLGNEMVLMTPEGVCRIEKDLHYRRGVLSS